VQSWVTFKTVASSNLFCDITARADSTYSSMITHETCIRLVNFYSIFQTLENDLSFKRQPPRATCENIKNVAQKKSFWGFCVLLLLLNPISHYQLTAKCLILDSTRHSLLCQQSNIHFRMCNLSQNAIPEAIKSDRGVIFHDGTLNGNWFSKVSTE